MNRKAMILAAGYGTRLGDLTKEIPKPMLPIQGRPLLEYLVVHLRRHGFNKICINLHYMPDIIINYFGDGSKLGVELTYSYEPELLGTAGGVKKMEDFLKTDGPFLVQYGDVLTDQDFSAMMDFHNSKKALATILLHQRHKSNSVVSLDMENKIIGFLERPTDEERKNFISPWVNSGVAILDQEIFNYIPANKNCDLPKEIYSMLITSGRLYGFFLSGHRCAIDSPQRFMEAQKSLDIYDIPSEINSI